MRSGALRPIFDNNNVYQPDVPKVAKLISRAYIDQFRLADELRDRIHRMPRNRLMTDIIGALETLNSVRHLTISLYDIAARLYNCIRGRYTKNRDLKLNDNKTVPFIYAKYGDSVNPGLLSKITSNQISGAILEIQRKIFDTLLMFEKPRYDKTYMSIPYILTNYHYDTCAGFVDKLLITKILYKHNGYIDQEYRDYQRTTNKDGLKTISDINLADFPDLIPQIVDHSGSISVDEDNNVIIDFKSYHIKYKHIPYDKFSTRFYRPFEEFAREAHFGIPVLSLLSNTGIVLLDYDRLAIIELGKYAIMPYDMYSMIFTLDSKNRLVNISPEFKRYYKLQLIAFINCIEEEAYNVFRVKYAGKFKKISVPSYLLDVSEIILDIFRIKDTRREEYCIIFRAFNGEICCRFCEVKNGVFVHIRYDDVEAQHPYLYHSLEYSTRNNNKKILLPGLLEIKFFNEDDGNKYFIRIKDTRRIVRTEMNNPRCITEHIQGQRPEYEEQHLANSTFNSINVLDVKYFDIIRYRRNADEILNYRSIFDVGVPLYTDMHGHIV
jgi:hypothetical protein